MNPRTRNLLIYFSSIPAWMLGGALYADRFELGAVDARPGETALSVPVYLETDASADAADAWSIVIGFDPGAIGEVSLHRSTEFASEERNVVSFFRELGRVGLEIAPLDSSGLSLPIEPGTRARVAELRFCILAEASAGRSQLSVLPEAGHASGGTVRTFVRRGESEMVADGVDGWVSIAGDSVAGGDCRRHEPLPPPFPDLPTAVLSIGDASASPGESFSVELSLEADGDAQALSWSIDFDESVLEGRSVGPSLGVSPDDLFLTYEFANEDEAPGGSGVDEGYAVGAHVFSWIRTDVVPAGARVVVQTFEFAVRDGATLGTTELRFRDGGAASYLDGADVVNNVTVAGWPADLELGSGALFVNGRVEVVGDIGMFVRGDSNGDGDVDLSDGVATLGYLFLGGARLDCDDAADANDDGRLNVSDPVATLMSLFSGAGPLPAPSEIPGVDPTDDGLSCDPALP